MRTKTPVTRTMKELLLANHFREIDSAIAPVEHLKAIRRETDLSFTHLMESRRAHNFLSKLAIASTTIAVASEYLGFDRTAKVVGSIAGLTLAGTALTAKSSENLQEINETLDRSAQTYANAHFNKPISINFAKLQGINTVIILDPSLN